MWALLSEHEEILRYLRLLDDAWKNLLNDFKDEVFSLPWVEGPVRGYLFAECLKLMRLDGHFKTPYQIWEEETYGRLEPDITLGSLGEKAEKRIVAVEVKYVGTTDKTTQEKVEKDIRKLDEYLDLTFDSYFVMIDTCRRYREILDLKSLGIKEGCWEWQSVTTKGMRSFDALMVWKGQYVEHHL